MLNNQKGIAQVLVLLIVLLGLGLGVYLVQKQTSLRSKAGIEGAESSINLVGFVQENQAIDRPQDNPTVSVPAGTDFYVYVLVKANVDPVNLISAKLTVPTDLVSETIDIQTLDSSGGVISSWVESVYDAEKKQVSLVGGIPNPGFQNNVGQSGKMARLKFRTLDGLTDGKTARIDFLEADTNMYKNSDNQPIQPLIKRSLTVKIGPVENTVPVESVSYTLQSSWNFIGVPVNPDITPKQLLDATNGKCDAIQGFDSNRSQATAYFSDPAKAVLNSLEKIEGGRAYQIKCSESGVTFTLTGSAVTSMPTLLPKTNNYISLPKGKTMKPLDFLNQVSNNQIDCDKVYRWVADGWELYNKTRPIRDFDMTDTEGYNVMCESVGSAPKTPPCQSYGDVNNDGKITAEDANWILEHVSGSRQFDNDTINRADVNKDGKVSSVDTLLIQKYINGTESTFSVCTTTSPAPSISPSPSPATCAQVITPGLKPSTKECKDFPNACLPEGWTKLKGEGCAKAGDLAGDGKFELGRNFSSLFSKFNNPDGSKPQGWEKADINGDGVINSVDFSLIRVIYIGKGLIKEFLR